MLYFKQFFMGKEYSETMAEIIGYIITIFLILSISFIVYFIFKKYILKLVFKAIRLTKYQHDDIFWEKKVIHRIIILLPFILMYLFTPMLADLEALSKNIISCFIFIIAAFAISAALDAINDIYMKKDIAKRKPIKGFLQVVKIIVFAISATLAVSSFLNESPLIILGSIGAMTAVISLIFKDSILGFVAGIQLSNNDMLRIGDWIEMPKYGADGDVVDISLNTVKVQNFDKTYTTIPAYSLISDSFTNWRGMKEIGGRRIKRSVYVDVNSVKFCTEKNLEKYKEIQLLTEYINSKQTEIEEYNENNNINKNLLINGRHMTNIGTFRMYILKYLQNNKKIHKELPLMVRQLAPTEIGVPIEIYVFTNDTIWQNYEGIQADIFDHIFAIAEEFDLRLFQNPSGYDLKRIGTKDI